MSHYDYPEHVAMAVNELRKKIPGEGHTIHAEQQQVKGAHRVLNRIHSVSNILMHLHENHYSDLADQFLAKFFEIQEKIESGVFQELRIIKEERKAFAHLKKDAAHNNWRAVRKDLQSDRKVHALSAAELKELWEDFAELAQIIADEIQSLEKDMHIHKEREKHDSDEEFYWLQLLKFARTYERIFQDLYAKEQKP